MFCGGSKPRKHQVKPGKMASTQAVTLKHLPKCGVEEPFCVWGCRGNTNQILVSHTTGKHRCDIVTEQPKLSLNVFPVSQTDVQ